MNYADLNQEPTPARDPAPLELLVAAIAAALPRRKDCDPQEHLLISNMDAFLYGDPATVGVYLLAPPGAPAWLAGVQREYYLRRLRASGLRVTLERGENGPYLRVTAPAGRSRPCVSS